MMKEANFYGAGVHRDAWHHFEPPTRCSWDTLRIAKGQFKKVTWRQSAQTSINIEYASNFYFLCEQNSTVLPDRQNGHWKLVFLWPCFPFAALSLKSVHKHHNHVLFNNMLMSILTDFRELPCVEAHEKPTFDISQKALWCILLPEPALNEKLGHFFLTFAQDNNQRWSVFLWMGICKEEDSRGAQ